MWWKEVSAVPTATAQPTTAQPITRAGPSGFKTSPFPEGLPRLADRWQSWYSKQVAHTQMSTINCRWDRFLLVSVVILSTIMGSSFIASIGQNPPSWLKAILGVLGLTAAVLAALKERVPFAKYEKDHGDAAAGFEDLRYWAEELADQLSSHAIPPEQASTRLHTLENKAERLDRDSPRLGAWRIGRAVRSIKRMRKDRNDLNKVFTESRMGRG